MEHRPSYWATNYQAITFRVCIFAIALYVKDFGDVFRSPTYGQRVACYCLGEVAPFKVYVQKGEQGK